MKWFLATVVIAAAGVCVGAEVTPRGVNWMDQSTTRWVSAAARELQDADYAALLKDAKISLAEGIEKGLAESKEGIVYRVELEGDKTTHWAVDVAKGDRVFAVDIDVRTGKVVGSELENEDQSTLAKSAQIPILQAIETALKKAPGQAVGVALRLAGEKPLYEVRVLVKDKVKIVRVDAVSGQLISRKAQGRKDAEAARAFTDAFPVESGDWASTGRNPYFILEPGSFQVLEGKEEGKDVRVTITVLPETRQIDGVETRIVEDKVFENGQLAEDTRDYFAFSKKTAGIYYFGEDVDNYKDGKIDNHKGSWRSGVNGAKYGLQMPGIPLLGARYYQELAPGAGMDRIEIVSLSEMLETPAGKFDHCLKTEETSPLEPGVRESKLYAPGIGVIQEGEVKLVRYGMTPSK